MCKVWPSRPQTKPSSSSAPAFYLPFSPSPNLLFTPPPTHRTHKTKCLLAPRDLSCLVSSRRVSFSAHARLCCEAWGEAESEGAQGVRRAVADGEGAVLRQDQGPQEGALDAGGGQAPRRLHPDQRPWQLAPAPQARRSEFHSSLVPFHLIAVSTVRRLLS